MIVAEQSYEVTDPTIDSQIISLKNSGADIFFNITTPEVRRPGDPQGGRHRLEAPAFPEQRLELGRLGADAGRARQVERPDHLALPEGPDRPAVAGQPGVSRLGRRGWTSTIRAPTRPIVNNVYGYNAAMTLVQVLKQCGDDLTRANVMHEAANLKNLELPMLLPGVVINTSPTDFYPIQSMQLAKFDGEKWVLFGDVIDASKAK